MSVAQINGRLKPGESIIENPGSVDSLDFTGSSLVGTRTFYLSNQGRVFVHDTGGLFGDPKVIVLSLQKGDLRTTFDDQVRVVYSKKNEYNLSFSLLYSLPNFLSLSRQAPGLFDIPTDCTYVKIDQSFFPVQMKMTCEAIHLTSGGLENTLPLRRVTSCQYEKPYLKLTGRFAWSDGAQKDRTVTKAELLVLDEPAARTIVANWSRSPKLFDLVPIDAMLLPGEYAGSLDDAARGCRAALLALSETKAQIVDEAQMRLLAEQKADIEQPAIAYDPYTQSIYLFHDDDNCRLSLTDPKKEEQDYLFQRFGDGSDIFLTEVFGSLGEKACMGEKLLFVHRQGECRFIDPAGMETVQRFFDLDAAFYFNNSGIPFIIHRDQVLSLRLSEEDKQSVYTMFWQTDVSLQKLSQTGLCLAESSNQPFLLRLDADGCSLMQDSSRHLDKFPYSSLKRIQYVEIAQEEDDFCRISLFVQGRGEVPLRATMWTIKGLIQGQYSFLKKEATLALPDSRLFAQWSQAVNDYIMTQLFSQFFIIEVEIQRLHAAEVEEKEKFTQIANYLFYAMQGLKKHLDMLSIYLPMMLKQEEQRLARKAKQNIKVEVFKNLQRALSGITGQLSRSLSEVERSLGPISYVIVPQPEIEDDNSDLVRWGATIASVAINPAYAVNLVRMFFDEDARDNREKAKDELERNRLKLYVEQALHSYEYTMRAVLPYCISETSETVSKYYKSLGDGYATLLKLKPAREMLFERFSELHLYKEMPVSASHLLTRRAMLEKIRSSMERMNAFIRQCRWTD
ncbi:hypothetical protein GTO89_12325 [Heliobacterium gestii]|uniref:Uncharacterized protein n=1 Tax=Heliomicrobium gestii TaxID=2699 RepID=A0A845LEL4_HELGE|nr:hypothetical protein [Heliomicrobium gestii]MBM7867268.1 hypothetical protein [Heliomicrobium gestii]MZP43824.1 hypothetical protein [Heliomicrobium gestii]